MKIYSKYQALIKDNENGITYQFTLPKKEYEEFFNDNIYQLIVKGIFPDIKFKTGDILKLTDGNTYLCKPYHDQWLSKYITKQN